MATGMSTLVTLPPGTMVATIPETLAAIGTATATKPTGPPRAAVATIPPTLAVLQMATATMPTRPRQAAVATIPVTPAVLEMATGTVAAATAGVVTEVVATSCANSPQFMPGLNGQHLQVDGSRFRRRSGPTSSGAAISRHPCRLWSPSNR
jgi:hypothetical protein